MCNFNLIGSGDKGGGGGSDWGRLGRTAELSSSRRGKNGDFARAALFPLPAARQVKQTKKHTHAKKIDATGSGGFE